MSDLKQQLAILANAGSLTAGFAAELKVIAALLIDKGVLTAEEIEAKAKLLFEQSEQSDQSDQSKTKTYKELPNGQRLYPEDQGYHDYQGAEISYQEDHSRQK